MFSGSSVSDVAFPKEKVQEQEVKKVTIADILGDSPTYANVFDQQKDGPRIGF